MTDYHKGRNSINKLSLVDFRQGPTRVAREQKCVAVTVHERPEFVVLDTAFFATLDAEQLAALQQEYKEQLSGHKNVELAVAAS